MKMSRSESLSGRRRGASGIARRILSREMNVDYNERLNRMATSGIRLAIVSLRSIRIAVGEEFAEEGRR